MGALPRIVRVAWMAALASCGTLLGCSSSSSSGGVSPPDASADGRTDIGIDASADAGTEAAADAREDGASGEGGGPCMAFSDCPQGFACGYAIADGCSASGVCIPFFIGACACDGGGLQYCNCSGQATTASCCYPQGYQPFPVGPSSSCRLNTDAAADAIGE